MAKFLRRSLLVRLVAALFLFCGSGLLSAAERLSPGRRRTGPPLYRFPGGFPIEWEDQQNGDLIVCAIQTDGRLTGLDVWKVAAEGPVFKDAVPGSAYRPVNADDLFSLIPSWAVDKQVDSLEAFLAVRHSIRAQRENSPWAEIASRFGGNQPLSPEALNTLQEAVASAGWTVAKPPVG